jgi:hypothetical protein
MNVIKDDITEKEKRITERISRGEKVLPLQNTSMISQEEHEYIKKMMIIRPLVTHLYSTMDRRIALGNLIVSSMYYKLGFDPGKDIKKKDLMEQLELLENEEKKDNETEEEFEKRLEKQVKVLKMLNVITSEYKRITDGMISLKQEIKAMKKRDSKIITDEAELVLIDDYMHHLKMEKDATKVIEMKVAQNFPELNEWLNHINGVGPKMKGYLLAFLNPYRARHASCYISYCGLAVEPDGKATGKQHMVLREYVDKNKNIKIKESLKYSNHMKSKMLTFSKMSFCKKSSPYRIFYDQSKQKDLLIKKIDPKQKAWIFKRAIRAPIKRFLIDFWVKHRESVGLPTDPSYEVAKLGMFDHPSVVNM